MAMNRSLIIERKFDFASRAENLEDGADKLIIEGYALKFNSPTVLFEENGIQYKETILPEALENCKMADVIFNYNHQGKVLARTRNSTLELLPDSEGLFIRARLDGTAEGRQMYEEISKGYIDKMSFAFTIAEEAFNKDERMWTIRRIKRIYDVSAVDFPAYEDTWVEARKAAILEAEAQEKRQAAEAALARRKLQLKLKF